VDLSQPASLVLRLFNYPAWRIEVNGRLVEATTLEDTGQIVIPAEAGKSGVQLSFMRTADRTAGGIISVLTAVCLLMWWLRKRLRVS
jgi:hypothetical protein